MSFIGCQLFYQNFQKFFIFFFRQMFITAWLLEAAVETPDFSKVLVLFSRIPLSGCLNQWPCFFRSLSGFFPNTAAETSDTKDM
jgi:hypothetical protein